MIHKNVIDRKLLMRWDQRIRYIWTTSKPWNHWLIQLIMRLWKLNSGLVVTYAMLSRICFFALKWSWCLTLWLYRMTNEWGILIEKQTPIVYSEPNNEAHCTSLSLALYLPWGHVSTQFRFFTSCHIHSN